MLFLLVAVAGTAWIAECPLLAAPPTVEKWSLWSDGVRLRGANVYQRRRYPFDGPDFLGPGPLGPPYTQDDFNRLAALGANAVVLSHPGLFTENPPYAIDADVQASLDAFINMASRAGLYVVISFRTGPGRSEATFDYFPENTYDNDRVWTDQQAHDAWPAMWRATAQRYKDNPVVVGYDLMVEPNSSGRLLNIYDPAEFYARYAGSLYDWNALYPSIVRAIREVDSMTPILVGGNNWSAAAWLPFVQADSDPRIVYTAHFYEPFTYTAQGPSAGLTYPGTFDPGDGVVQNIDGRWLRSAIAPVDAFRSAHPGKPVAITEFGVSRWAGGAGTYFSDVTSLFEEKGLNHFLWAWPSSWGPISDVDQFDYTHGPDPNLHVEDPASTLFAAVRADFARNRPARRRAVR